MEGLTQSQVLTRRQRGQGNDLRTPTGRTYLQIVRQNAFTFINSVLFAIGIVLVLMGQFEDALVTAGLVLLNVVVGVVQEARAKHKLEQIALLARPKASVIRDGQEQVIDPAEIVLDDLLLVRPGDQIVADGQIVAVGQVLGDGSIEVDESLLSGESEPIRKGAGDAVFSGSFCIGGRAYFQAQKVGADSLVNQLTAGARAFRQVKTPLQRDIDFIIRLLVFVVAQVGILLGISFAMRDLPLVEGVRIAAVIVALVPQGLFFMTTVAYAMGVLRVAGKGALIQQINAVESTSNVDLLCLDKTGTLTSNRIQLHAVHPVGEAGDGDEARLRHILGDYAASTEGGNRTTAALAEALSGQPRRVVESVPFVSERKWSALSFDDADLCGAYVLGAPEVLQPHLAFDPDPGGLVDEWTAAGLRVLLFAHPAAARSLHNAGGEPQLPDGLVPLALLSFRDELRPGAGETLRHFEELGIGLKIISGDHPQTVVALARQAGFSGSLHAVSGLDLDPLDGDGLGTLAGETSIFGRISPQQKEELVRIYRRLGHYVAMIGDGVNDVLSLKQADVGIAMQSGSQATRSVADIVLLGDSFGALPIAFREGQRIVNGMQDVVRLLLTRTFYVMLLVIATAIVGVPFPVTPKHNSVLALVTVGIPILAIAAWARPGTPQRPGDPPRRVLRSTSRFVFPAAFTVAVVALAVYLAYLSTTADLALARTALTTVSILCGLLLIPFVEPPTKWWVGGDELSGDPRPSLLALGMLALYTLILAVPPLRTFFELALLRPLDYLLIALAAALWALLLRAIWRAQLFERLLNLDTT